MRFSVKKLAVLVVIILLALIVVKIMAQPSQSSCLYDSVIGLNGLRLF